MRIFTEDSHVRKKMLSMCHYVCNNAQIRIFWCDLFFSLHFASHPAGPAARTGGYGLPDFPGNRAFPASRSRHQAAPLSRSRGQMPGAARAGASSSSQLQAPTKMPQNGIIKPLCSALDINTSLSSELLLYPVTNPPGAAASPAACQHLPAGREGGA